MYKLVTPNKTYLFNFYLTACQAVGKIRGIESRKASYKKYDISIVAAHMKETYEVHGMPSCSNCGRDIPKNQKCCDN